MPQTTMETKTCIACGKTLPLDDFPIRHADGKPHTRCADCYREYNRLYHYKRAARAEERRILEQEKRKVRQEQEQLLKESILEVIESLAAYAQISEHVNKVAHAKRILEKRSENSIF